MDAARFFSERYPLDPVYAGLVPQRVICAGTGYLEREIINAMRPPPLVVGIFLIHFFQVAGKDCRFVAAGTGAQFKNDRTRLNLLFLLFVKNPFYFRKDLGLACAGARLILSGKTEEFGIRSGSGGR